MPSRRRSQRAISEWEIIEPPAIRDVDPDARYFTPWKIVPPGDPHANGRGATRDAAAAYYAVSHRRARTVPDGAISSPVCHTLRAAETICTNARRRRITSQRSGYCRLERLTIASSEAAVSTNSCRSGRLGTPPLPTCLGVVPLAATARNSCAARSI